MSISPRLVRPVRTLALISSSLGLAMGASLPEVSVTVTKPTAYESDPARLFGEFEVSRNNVSGDLAVSLLIAGSAAFQVDWDGQVTYTNGTVSGTSSFDPLGTSVTVVIPDSRSRMLVRVAPKADADVYPAEYMENVSLRLVTARDVNGKDTYVVSDNNAKEVKIVDANVTGVLTALIDSAAEILAPSVTPGYAPTNNALMRVWFQNSADARGTNPATFFDAYHISNALNGDGSLIGRTVELTLGGTATKSADYIIQYKIGGTQFSADDVDGKPVSQPWAYRLLTEDGNNTYGDVAGLNSNAVGGITTLRVADPVPTTGVFNLRITSITWNNPIPAGPVPTPTQIFTPPIAQWPTSVSYRDETVWQTELSNTGIAASYTATGTAQTYTNCWQIRGVSADGRTLTIFPAITNSDIPQGARLNVSWDTVQVVKETLGGTPPVVTTLGQVIPTARNLETTIAENTLYPAGSVTVSVYSPGVLRIAQVGDVFAFSNNPTQWYRIVGPTPGIAGGPVNRDFTGRPRGQASVGASNEFNSFIAFWPELKRPILRSENVTIISHFTPTFDGNRETISIPALPRPLDTDSTSREIPRTFNRLISQYWPNGTYQNPPKTPDGLPTPNDLPNGDWIDFNITPTDDGAVEGAETVTLTLNTSNANNGYEIRDPAVSTVIIRDNDAIVDIKVTSNAAEPTKSGIFTVTSSAAFPRDINILFKLTTDGLIGNLANWETDTPVAGTRDFVITNLDRSTGTGFVTLKAGQTSVDILVDPIDDSNATENTELLKVQLLDSDDYVLRTTSSSDQNATAASMEIVDTIATVSVDLRDKLAEVYEGQTDSAKFPAFVVTAARRPGYTGDITVPLTITGTAENGVDYGTRDAGGVLGPIGTSVTIASANSTAAIVVEPRTDALKEFDETSILTLGTGTNYLLGSSLTSATIAVKDGNPPTVGTTTGPSTTTTGPSTTTTGPSTTTGVNAGADVEQNSGCGAGSGIAILTGLLALIGFRRRLR